MNEVSLSRTCNHDIDKDPNRNGNTEDDKLVTNNDMHERPVDSSDDEDVARKCRKRSESPDIIYDDFFSTITNERKEIPEFTLQDELLLSIYQKEEIHQLILTEMFTWSSFIHMKQLDQELMWLVEASKVVAHDNMFNFVKNHSKNLQPLLEDSTNIKSVSALVRRHFEVSDMNVKLEFILKRSDARKKIIQLYSKLVDFEVNSFNYFTKNVLSKYQLQQIESFLSTAYLRHNKLSCIHNTNDIRFLLVPDVYAEFEYSIIKCRVLGCKYVASNALYFNVEIEGHVLVESLKKSLAEIITVHVSWAPVRKSKRHSGIQYISIERVHPQSLFTLEDCRKHVFT